MIVLLDVPETFRGVAAVYIDDGTYGLPRGQRRPPFRPTRGTSCSGRIFHSNCAKETFVQRKEISTVCAKGKRHSRRAKDFWRRNINRVIPGS
jgi:hypothetical protein